MQEWCVGVGVSERPPLSLRAHGGGWWGLADPLPSGFSRDSWSCRQGQDVTSLTGENPSAPVSLTKPPWVLERGSSSCRCCCCDP